MNKCIFGHKFTDWKKGYQNFIDTQTKVKTVKKFQTRTCKRCNFEERYYI